MTKEIERAKLPIVCITALDAMAKQVSINRIVRGVAIPHTCGDPHLPPEEDKRLRREIVSTALKALQTSVTEPTIFYPRQDVATSVF